MTLLRVGGGPLLTRHDIPAMPPVIVDPSSVFNPGAVLVDGPTFLLLRVSGVAMLERSIGKRRPEYAAYVERTSAFFPRPPRRA